MPPEYDDETEGQNPNEGQRPPLPRDAGITLTLVGGPLHGRNARLRDSLCCLWYAIDSDDRPTVRSAVDAPRLEPDQRILGYYAFREADETAVWHRPPAPAAPLPVPVPAMGAPRWFYPVIASAAIVAALSLVVAARRPVPGRWTKFDGQTILDTQTGTMCGISAGSTVCFDMSTSSRITAPASK